MLDFAGLALDRANLLRGLHAAAVLVPVRDAGGLGAEPIAEAGSHGVPACLRPVYQRPDRIARTAPGLVGRIEQVAHLQRVARVGDAIRRLDPARREAPAHPRAEQYRLLPSRI